ncbi:MAG: nicotinate-nucleotide adenylyltransferase [Betaproteobacteria bacterium]|uniref:nicotinate-nucleotide adenylyltransferase n=1 Tax=Ferrovum sp. PN-J185 TaxID=1356306 RepID=UPI000799144C|nr:nicotinate-nucleotide adenylyltransferase [Ferrovum sp. PN-J185]KXW55581.1 putative nicotinate-nucleotide adenylyltransferase [Ferrovum sp. PN-J185]MDE1891208.1 nicotinate-nucleotide adenylyltransferase [Betaproteobacteria bacterium]MDE2056248.1 nicotinate-nucleotide adenylyltransferase [Betaproteobacteria bacterium]
MKAQGYFGGTFDPIHNGHLSVAQQLIDKLALETLWFLPAGSPWQRTPQADAQHRLAMVKLALSNYPYFKVDEREVHRQGLTYTIDTLKEIRAEQGGSVPLWFVIGADSFLNLTTWHNWQELLNYCHLAVACRPDYSVNEDKLSPQLRSLLIKHYDSDPQNVNDPAGKLSIINIEESPISATAVRHCLQQHKDIQSVVPNSVYHYIHQHHLYQ